ncbi:hypothetical protein BDA99DRAFT_523123 [Phascolomyces articulosus]|uniref:DUF7905 domain-containing protein n=1 Tax=Phascolomyces articulosus TaxID=60185 RepID=A0AAD5K110_9FUNG|nr:hypothetical protein BDA99DRAFT_523123 [Phascolomyces articulosus]
MVQPNNRVYPVAWISRARYEEIRNQLNVLTEKNNTDIYFNEKEQYFEIKGRSTQTTEQVSRMIVQKLIPYLYADLDLILGTESASVDYESAMRPPSDSTNATSKPLISSSSAPVFASDEDDSYSDDSEYSYSDDSLDYMRPKKTKDKGKKRSAFDQSKAMQKKANEAHGTFTFAKNVKDPEEILFGPPFETMAAADYLYIIGRDTETECSLDKNRTVQVFGYDDASVNSAIDKFRFLQTLHKRLRRSTAVTPCLHYRAEGEYCLYFCNLHDYKDESFVVLPRDYRHPTYVLITSFKDPKSGQFMRPSGLVSTATTATTTKTSSAGQMGSPSRKKQQQQQQQQSLSGRGSPASPSSSIYDELDQRFSDAYISSPNMSPSSSSWSSGQFTERTNAPPGQAPLWGEQKYTTTPSSSSPRGRGRGRGGQTIERPRWGAPPPGTVTNDDFPALGGGSGSGRGRGQQPPQRGGNGGRGRRVMRLTPQKSSRPKSNNSKSMLSMAKEYNMHNVKQTLSDSLETARQFRGEVTLVAKLGKVLWKNLPENIDKNKIWQYTDIKDVCMNEYKIQPTFNNVSMTRDDIAQTLWRAVEGSFGPPVKNNNFFEIHVNARSKMSEPIRPAVLYTESTWANFYKVDLQEFRAAEIDWVSLDAKFDFQLALTMKEIGRKEVSPFKPFIRRVALRPSNNGRTNALSYQHVAEGRLLNVKEIYHKQVSKFKVNQDVILQMTRIETVPRQLETTGSEAQYSATTGRGPISFDIELIYTPYQNLFKQNVDKPIFENVKWTQDDIFGEKNQVFSKFIAAILQTMNIIEKALG